MDIEEEGRATTTRQHRPAVGARLYFNYTTGCENLVQSRCFSLSLFLFCSSRGAPPKCEEIKTGGEQTGRPTASALWTVSVGFSIAVRPNFWSFLSSFHLASRAFPLSILSIVFSFMYFDSVPSRNCLILCSTLNN